MAKSDLTVFLENLKMWDHPTPISDGPPILKKEDNIERIVDEMFERFCNMELDRAHSFVGNC